VDGGRGEDSVEEEFCVVLARGSEELLTGAGFDDDSIAQDEDIVRHVMHGGHVVGDEEVGDGTFLLEVGEEIENLGTDGDVEGGGWFVADDERGFEHEGADDGQSLALPAGELVRVPMDGVGRHAAAGEEGAGGVFAVLVREMGPMNLQGFGEDFKDAMSRVHGPDGVLKDHLHLGAGAAEFGGAEEGEVAALQEHAPGGEGDEAEDGAGEGGLTGARFADDGEGPAGGEGEGNVVEDGAGTVSDAERVNVEQGRVG
jgi:hypothetical protein